MVHFNHLSASQTLTKTLEVPLAVHGVRSGLVANVRTQQVTVEIAGARAALEDLVPEDFVAYVDCSGKHAGTFTACRLRRRTGNDQRRSP